MKLGKIFISDEAQQVISSTSDDILRTVLNTHSNNPDLVKISSRAHSSIQVGKVTFCITTCSNHNLTTVSISFD